VGPQRFQRSGISYLRDCSQSFRTNQPDYYCWSADNGLGNCNYRAACHLHSPYLLPPYRQQHRRWAKGTLYRLLISQLCLFLTPSPLMMRGLITIKRQAYISPLQLMKKSKKKEGLGGAVDDGHDLMHKIYPGSKILPEKRSWRDSLVSWKGHSRRSTWYRCSHILISAHSYSFTESISLANPTPTPGNTPASLASHEESRYYVEQIKAMKDYELTTLYVDMSHLLEREEVLARAIRSQYYR
jgi:hypothetical protein